MAESVKITRLASENIIVRYRHLDRVSAYRKTQNLAREFLFQKFRNFLYFDDFSIAALPKTHQ